MYITVVRDSLQAAHYVLDLADKVRIQRMANQDLDCESGTNVFLEALRLARQVEEEKDRAAVGDQ